MMNPSISYVTGYIIGMKGGIKTERIPLTRIKLTYQTVMVIITVLVVTMLQKMLARRVP